MASLQTLLVVYALILVINTGIAVALWWNYRETILVRLIGVWLFTLINFVVQGATLQSPIGSVVGFSIYIGAAACLCAILAELKQREFDFRSYAAIFLIAWISAPMSYLFSGSFFWLSLPIAFSIALPQLVFGWNFFREKNNSLLESIFAIVLIINGLHFLDYPVLRPVPEYAVMGYSIVIATSMLFGILLPCIINNYLAERLTKTLIQEIEEHKATAKKLAIAVDTAERFSKAKTVFLSNMSHEMRTPINGIIGLNALLLETDLNEEQLGYASRIKDSSDRLIAMVANVLTLSQLESSTVALNLRTLSLNDIITAVTNNFKFRNISSLRLTVKTVEPEDLRIVVDVDKIYQIFFQLTDNAVKHSRSDEIEIGMCCDSYSDQKGDLIFWVKDKGVGVPEESISGIMRRFEQENYEFQAGAGLGLSIVKGLLTSMSGYLSIESHPNQGFEVLCHIPVGIATEQKTVAKPEKVTTSPTNAIQHAASTRQIENAVLVVEDNPTNRMVIAGMLKKLNIPYVLAEDGTTAMKAYEANSGHWSAIFMDVQLPDANGLDLVARIRAQGDQVTILVISAFAFAEDEDKAFNVGANGYLRKPYNFDQFKHLLNEHHVVAA